MYISVTEEVSWKVELGVRPEICRDSLVVGSRRGIRMYVTVLICIFILGLFQCTTEKKKMNCRC